MLTLPADTPASSPLDVWTVGAAAHAQATRKNMMIAVMPRGAVASASRARGRSPLKLMKV